MASCQTKDVTFQGLRVVYDSYGQGSEALVFLHGWCCDSTQWSGQAPLLSCYRSIVVDVPGHGHSEAPVGYDYSTENFAEAVHTCLVREHVSKVVLVGHSMGVTVANMFLRLHSDMVLGIVYVDGPFVPPHCEQSRAERAASVPFLENDEQFRAQFASMLGPQLSKEKGTQILDTMLGSPKHMRVESLRSATAWHSWKYSEVFNVPAVRTYSVFGPADPRWQHHLPTLVDEPWEGHGHWLQMEDPERFNKRVVDFLAEHQLLKAQ